MISYTCKVVNTLHWVPTGVYYVDKKGMKKEKKRPVVFRRLFLTALPGCSAPGMAANLRIVQVVRGGPGSRITLYSLSERAETCQSTCYAIRPPKVAEGWTRVCHSGNGKPVPAMSRADLGRLCGLLIRGRGNAKAALKDLETGKPMEGAAKDRALQHCG